LATRLVALNLDTGVETDLGIEGASYFAATGTELAWIDASFQAISLRDLGTGRDQGIVDYRAQGQAGPHLQFLSLSERLITWGQTGGAWAYDRKLDILVRLASAEPFTYVYLKGGGLDWLDGRGPGEPRTKSVLRLLETSSLP
jgi:hypothetical protein